MWKLPTCPEAILPEVTAPEPMVAANVPVPLPVTSPVREIICKALVRYIAGASKNTVLGPAGKLMRVPPLTGKNMLSRLSTPPDHVPRPPSTTPEPLSNT